ncbi:PAS domain-containing protein [Mucilaginibacter myungsuensis]|uniref:histidine kinase n=2 Tax=Mucilaginibacter myungsuensis TaxID=649104 RepID=A0A929PY40_9SPHI|nr:PAS domain-containing protein [Mucilaginibacter myungsuensis]
MRPLDGRGFLLDTQEPISGWRERNIFADDLEMANAAIKEAIAKKQIFELEHRVNRADGSTGWTFSRAVPILNAKGEITEWFGTASDITERKRTAQQRKDEQQQLQLIINMLPASVVVIRGDDLIVEMINQANLDYWHKTAAEVVGKPFLEILPDLADQPFAGQLRQVMATGEIIDVKESPVLFENADGSIRETFVDYTYQPLTDASGQRNGVLVMSFEITERVAARKLLEETNAQLARSEARFKYLIQDAPVAIGVLHGRELLIASANKMILKVWGKTRSIMGLPVAVALPEIQGQPFLQLLDEVFTSGRPYFGSEVKALLENEGQLQEIYLNFVYQPITDGGTDTTDILVVAVDVTAQVNAREELQHINEEMAAANEELATTNEELTEMQQLYQAVNRELETSASRLRMAIESTSLGTWEYDPPSGDLYWSKECREVYGIAENETPTYADFAEHIHPGDRTRVEAVIAQAMDPAGQWLLWPQLPHQAF